MERKGGRMEWGGEVRREKGKREEGGGAAVCCDAWRKQGPDRINA